MLDRIREARKNESGFTLIELLIVIVILGVLAGIVVFAVQGISDKGTSSACKSDIKTVTVAVEAYYAQKGSYPATGNVAAAGVLVPQFLHSYPDTVTYTLAGTAPNQTTTVVGADGANTKCAGITA